MEVDSSEAKPVELEALKKLIAATSSMLGGTSQEVLALQARLLQETPKRKEGTPVHVRLNQLEKRLLGIEKGMQKNEQAMDQAEEDLQQAASKVEEFRLLGKGLLHQQQELEEERASLIQGLQAGENFPVSVADPWVSKVSQMLSVVATHVDAGDETAKGLAMAFQSAAASLEANLQAYDTTMAKAETGVGGRAGSEGKGL